jgi:general secretion pathway protein I
LFRSATCNCKRARRACAGFTLIEVLVALMIVATLFSSLSALVVTAARGNRSVQDRLAGFETARALLTMLPSRDQRVPGTLSGAMNGYRWRLDARPTAFPDVKTAETTLWVPQAVGITMVAPNGATIRLDTIRLHRRPGV